MKNIFLDVYPEFIATDPRKDRATSATIGSFNVNARTQFIRHSTALPPESMAGKSILDLGCCCGATGAWVLHHGARRYVGVELHQGFAETAHKNLAAQFDSWQIENTSIEEYFSSNNEKFDIVVAFGIMFSGVFCENFIANLVQRADHVIIDSIDPEMDVPGIKFTEFASYGLDGHTITTAMPNLAATEILFGAHGFGMQQDHTNRLKTLLRNEYVKRFCASFCRSDRHQIKDFKTVYSEIPKTWSFDKNIAKIFVDHARHHIPGYEQVIDKCLDVCRQVAGLDSKIIDVGCATGHTLQRLEQAGFTDLYGVDNSETMLDSLAQLRYSKILLQDHFPRQHAPFRVILCNWTLHFIKDKLAYLADMYQSLDTGGYLVLSEKTVDSALDLDLYHHYKRTMGVSEQEILDKQQSLVGKMFVDPVDWYLEQLRNLGFSVSVIHGEFCFTTFLCYKK